MGRPDFDLIVIGAGVIGLAVARAAALSGRSVLIVEKGPQFGTETSSRNSEVIHAGIHYPHGSLKARLCVAGKSLLYEYCEDQGIPHRRCGKLVVALDDSQRALLEEKQAAAQACGVDDLHLLDGVDARKLEPEINCVAALLSPSTGIIDTHALMQSLLGAAEANGALLACNTNVLRMEQSSNSWWIVIEGEDEPVARARTIVNASGLESSAVARSIEGFPARQIPDLHFAKGCYFSYGGRTAFRHLVYPLPVAGGLGIHLTLDLSGRARFGPDVEWVDQVGYTVDPAKRQQFADNIRRFWPMLEPELLYPDYAGIRPKLSAPGEPAADFVIEGPADHGVGGIINLFGIESPGITASLAIADYVQNMMEATE